MLIVIEPGDEYFEFSHDLVNEEKGFNHPKSTRSWDWSGPREKGDKNKERRCRINGSEPITAKEMGKVIKHLVLCARKHGCGPLEYINLERGAEK